MRSLALWANTTVSERVIHFPRGPATFPCAGPTRTASRRLPSGSGASGRTQEPASALNQLLPWPPVARRAQKRGTHGRPSRPRPLLDPNNVRRAHQSLHPVVAVAPWNDQLLLQAVRHYVLPQMTSRARISAWVVDDTGFPKKAKHSVGVARQ